jgi:hypothetical protein
MEGDAPYYQDGDVVYSKKGEPRFSVSAGWWLEMGTGKAKFYVADCWVYSLSGKPAYYFG